MAKQFKAPVAEEAHGSILVDYVPTKNPDWCKCIYEDAEVLIQTKWRISKADCPNGLTEGCKYDHWWEEVEPDSFIMHLKQIID